MKMSELKKKQDGELIKMLREKRNEIREARFGGMTGGKTNLHATAGLRKDVARILTELRERTS